MSLLVIMDGIEYKKDLLNAFTGAEHEVGSQFRCFLETLRECLLPPKQEVPCLKHTQFYRAPRVAPLKQLMRECLLSQRWEEACHVLQTAVHEREGMDEAIWKGGLEVLLSDVETNRNDIDDFYRRISHLNAFKPDEVDINQLLYLLSDGRMERALHMDIKGRGRGSRSRETPLELLAEGYKGLIHFIRWLQLKASLEEPYLKQLPDNERREKEKTIMSNMRHSKSFAMLPFNVLLKNAGVWDIFVCALVQMLEFHGELDECKEYLQDYQERNPDNPNAHRYLYQFLCRRGRSPYAKLPPLKALLFCDPSNICALDLYDLLHELGDTTAISVLFDMLDFACWQQDDRPWKKFARRLKKLARSGSGDVGSVVAECWESREAWWPAYHFSPDRLDPASSPRLLQHKAAVASVLMGEGNDYSRAVDEYLSSQMPSRTGDEDDSMDTTVDEPTQNPD